MSRLSLTARAFLFSFLPVCLVLLASFAALSTANHQRIEEELRQSLQHSDRLLNRASLEYSRRTSGLLAKLTDSAGLKAAVGLLAEAHGNPSAMPEIRRTIEAQLRELQSASTYDFAAVSDLRGRTIAAVVFPDRQELAPLPALPARPGLQEVQHALYQLEPVPIEVGGDVTATLTLGMRFDLDRLPIEGQAVLLNGDRVVRSMLPASRNSAIEQQISDRCAKPISGCEIVLDGQTFVVSQLESGQLGDGYRLLGFRSLDSRVHELNAAFIRILIEVGSAGVLLAFLCTLITSYSVSQPLRSLVGQLKQSESTRQLPERLMIGNGVRELDSLVNAFNRVADAERLSRRELELAKDAAETANRLKTEFLANVSHELRTPMNGILGMTHVLLGTSLTEDQQEYATVVRDSGQSLMALIENVLDFSSLDSGKMRLHAAPLDLHEVLTAVTAEVRMRAAEKRIRVEMTYPASVPRKFVGDSTRLRQVLTQLAGNALKFTEKGSIGVHCASILQTASDAILKLSIEDTGIGIDPNNRNLIFQRFSQVDGSFTRPYGGTGLGLALAKELVELMGGEIGFDSRVNGGSTFWFTVRLPIAVPPAPSQDLALTAGGVLAC